jgi:hypothetical protein
VQWLTRWLAPGQQPRIVMGPAAWVREHE